MDIILLRRVEKLGQMGDVVNVAPGFFRNFLFPRGLADRATKERIGQFEADKSYIEAENLREKQEAQNVAGRMNNIILTFIRPAGDTGLLYGSVRTQEIATEMNQQGFKIDRTQVLIKQPIKSLGIHKVDLMLHAEVKLEILLNIALTPEEAANQLNKNNTNNKTTEDNVVLN